MVTSWQPWSFQRMAAQRGPVRSSWDSKGLCLRSIEVPRIHCHTVARKDSRDVWVGHRSERFGGPYLSDGEPRLTICVHSTFGSSDHFSAVVENSETRPLLQPYPRRHQTTEFRFRARRSRPALLDWLWASNMAYLSEDEWPCWIAQFEEATGHSGVLQHQNASSQM